MKQVLHYHAWSHICLEAIIVVLLKHQALIKISCMKIEHKTSCFSSAPPYIPTPHVMLFAHIANCYNLSISARKRTWSRMCKLKSALAQNVSLGQWLLFIWSRHFFFICCHEDLGAKSTQLLFHICLIKINAVSHNSFCTNINSFSNLNRRDSK